MVVETADAVGQQPNRLQKVVRNQRPEHIELEIARGAAEVDGHVVARHLTIPTDSAAVLSQSCQSPMSAMWLIFRQLSDSFMEPQQQKFSCCQKAATRGHPLLAIGGCSD